MAKGLGPGQVPLAAVVGHPVSHSASPRIFELLAQAAGLPVHYRRLDIPPKLFKATLQVARQLELFSGWNCTIPHKQQAAKWADERSPEVRCLGAANVLKFRRGKIQAYNTDILGVTRTLLDHEIAVRGQRAVIFGAGGASLAVGYALGKLGAKEVVIVNRTLANARRVGRRLTQAFPKTLFFPTIDTQICAALEVALYVNTTPLGMKGFQNTSVLPQQAYPGAWAFDLVYRPEQTVFLRDARRRGLKTVGGLDMLIWQAIGSWELWFGSLGEPSRVKRIFLKVRRNLRQELNS